MTTQTMKATEIRVGDALPTIDGKLRKVTGVDITAAAVRIRTGRSQQWSRSKHDAIFEVVR